MTRKFKVTNPNGTWLKLFSTDQADSLLSHHKIYISKDSIIETDHPIKTALNGHLEMDIKGFIFGDHLKEVNDELDFSSREETIRSIIKLCREQGLTLNTQIAYVLATVQWETAHTFKPVKEAYWKSELWRQQNLRYFPYYGRGFVQLTWKSNYAKFSGILAIDMIKDPDLALDPYVSAFILVYGFKHGTFTGKAIAHYINESKTDFIGARRCINGTDKAIQIKNLAYAFLRQLNGK
jgi:hypothetical protein